MDFKRHIETACNLTLGNVVSLILMTLVMVILRACSSSFAMGGNPRSRTCSPI